MSLLIKRANFIDSKLDLVTKRDILVEKGIIKKIGKIKKTITSMDGSSFLITPAFINAHIHLGETAYRGKVITSSLEKYLESSSYLTKKLSDSDYDAICAMTLIEAIKEGTSTVCCARGWHITKISKIKGCLGYPLMKSRKLRKFYEDFRTNKIKKEIGREDKNIRTDLWIHSLLKVDEEILGKVSKIFNKQKKIILSIHVAESRYQSRKSLRKFKKTEIQLLDQYNLLSPRTNLIHCNYLTKKDLDIICKKKANITICPTSNLILNNKLPDLKKMFAKKINISIGTDGLATNNSASLLNSASVTKLAYPSLKLSPKKLFNMITKNPAKTLLHKKTGRIKEGTYADMCFFDISNKNQLDLKCPLADLICAPISPKHLLVNGRFVMKNRQIKTLNQKGCMKKYAKIIKKIKK